MSFHQPPQVHDSILHLRWKSRGDYLSKPLQDGGVANFQWFLDVWWRSTRGAALDQRSPRSRTSDIGGSHPKDVSAAPQQQWNGSEGSNAGHNLHNRRVLLLWVYGGHLSALLTHHGGNARHGDPLGQLRMALRSLACPRIYCKLL
jgi:hypothetical protein